MDRRSFLQVGAAVGLAGLAGRGRLWGGTDAARDPTLWLSWNENPLGLSAKARQAAEEALERAHRYPDRARASLAVRLAERNGVQPENVVLGCGSTQILQTIVWAEGAGKKPLILAEPTFEAMARYQGPFASKIERVPLDARYAHDLGRMKARAAGEPVVVYICNPNNPTATLTASAEIDDWIRQAPESVVFAIDEAYHEYVESPGYESCVKWVAERPNVVVTRTFSKIYAMAGLRLGYALCHARTARRLREYISADNANGVVLAVAEVSLEDSGLIERSRQVNARSMQIATSCLDELGLAYLPSHANFLMHRVNGDLKTYIERMREAGIRVGRPFPPLTGFNRLSLGLPEEMERWAATLRTFRERGYA
jgi:histidinol-phosphate aminotransferase